jgi:DNA-binding IclR family transcriptional regulator
MSQSPAQFAIRTLRALEVLAFTPTTAPRVAEALGVHPRTARRLLSQLQRDGWLTYSGGRRAVYAPTLRLVALAAHVAGRAPLAAVTAPALERLRAETGLPAVLAIPSYQATVCIARCVGARAAYPPLEVIEPAHATAAGRVLLAHREPWRRSVLEELPRRWGRSTIDVEALQRELDQVRIDGHASARMDVPPGQLAAAVTAPTGEVLAAVGIDGVHADAAAVDRLAGHVRRAGEAASQALARAADRYPLQRTVIYRLLASYGLDDIDAYL